MKTSIALLIGVAIGFIAFVVISQVPVDIPVVSELIGRATTVTYTRTLRVVDTRTIYSPTTVTTTVTRTIPRFTTLTQTLTKLYTLPTTRVETYTTTVTRTRTLTSTEVVKKVSTRTLFVTVTSIRETTKTITKTVTASALAESFSFHGTFTSLTVNSTHISVFSKGHIHSIQFYRYGEPTPCCGITAEGYAPRFVPADTVYVDMDEVKIVAELRRVAQFLASGRYLAVVWSGFENPVKTVECILRVDEGKISFEECREVAKPTSISCEGISESLLLSILCGLTPEEIEVAGKKIYGFSYSREVAERIWRLVEWVDKNIEYDYRKKALEIPGVYRPSETLSLRRGVCIDYAVLYVAALLYTGIDRVFIITTSNPPHAAAMVYVDNIPVILEQHLPPRETADYIQYDFSGSLPVDEVIEISRQRDGGTVLKIRRYTSITVTDSWPQDIFPPNMAADVMEYLNRSAGIAIDPQLGSMLEYNVSFGVIRLPGVETFTELTVPLSVYYTPIFHSQWVRYIASNVVDLSKKMGIDIKSLWMEIREDTVKLAYTDELLPRVNVYRDDILLIEVRSSGHIDSVLLEITRMNLERVAGIAPPGYVYTNLKTVKADEWISENGFVSIEVSLDKLRSTLGNGEYLILIWVKEAGWDEEKLCYVYKLSLP